MKERNIAYEDMCWDEMGIPTSNDLFKLELKDLDIASEKLRE